MSRAYRIRVRESVQKVIRAEDHVSNTVELLDILPPVRMGELLGHELEKRGFERDGRTATRTQHGVTVEIELETGQVTVRAEAKDEIELNEEREMLADTDWSDSRKTQVEQTL